jgi:hypothetical protein
MSAESFNTTSSRIVTILIAETLRNQYHWTVVNDENHINRCREEIGPSSRIDGKIFSLTLFDHYLRIFKYRDYVPLMTRDGSRVKTKDGSLLVVPSDGYVFVLEFYDPIDFSARLKLNPSNSLSDLYELIVKNVFSVDEFLKQLEMVKQEGVK